MDQSNITELVNYILDLESIVIFNDYLIVINNSIASD